MKAFLVCDPDVGCVVRLAETASKARWAGACEMGAAPEYDFANVTHLHVRRIPAYDGDDPEAAYHAYWAAHDGETGLPIDQSEGDDQ